MQPISDPYASSQRVNEGDKKQIKSKSALSRYVFSGRGENVNKNSIDFDEIPSVQLRAEFNIPKRGGAVPDISQSNANISYTSSSVNQEEEKLLHRGENIYDSAANQKALKAYAGQKRSRQVNIKAVKESGVDGKRTTDDFQTAQFGGHINMVKGQPPTLCNDEVLP
jgi:hypothetical protein